MPSFSSSSVDPVTTTTATDTVPADDVKAQSNDSFEEMAADGTAGTD